MDGLEEMDELLEWDLGGDIESEYPLTRGPEHVYVLFCEATRQRYVATEAPKFFPCKAVNPILIKRKWTGHEYKEITHSLMPGYVFLFSDELMDPGKLWHLDGVLKVLRYSDGSYALTEDDERLARWLLKYDGTIGLSRAIRVGDRIQVVQGPLKDNLGEVTVVDKRRKRAKIELHFNDMVWPVWMDFDWVELDGVQGAAI